MIAASDLSTAFPSVNPGVRPLGTRVLVQLRRVVQKTASGLVLHFETREFNKSVTQLAKVVSMGPIAYHNRSTGEPWPEGVWVKVGELVRIPRFGGDRIEVTDPENADETITFAMFQDHEILSVVDPEVFSSIDDIR